MSSFQPEFALSQPALRLRFGPGVRRDTGVEIERLGCARAAVLSTPGKTGMTEELAAEMGGLAAGIVPLAKMHTPVPVTETALGGDSAARGRLPCRDRRRLHHRSR